MRCKKIQHFLMTDYLDGEISQALSRDIEQHLKGCNRCRVFLKELKSVQAPFKNVESIAPPTYVWQRIREKIIAEPILQAPPIVDRLGHWLKLPLLHKPQLAVATLALILVFIFIFSHLPFQSYEPTEAFTDEEKSVMFVFNGNGATFIDYFGTELEEYFL